MDTLRKALVLFGWLGVAWFCYIPIYGNKYQEYPAKVGLYVSAHVQFGVANASDFWSKIESGLGPWFQPLTKHYAMNQPGRGDTSDLPGCGDTTDLEKSPLETGSPVQPDNLEKMWSSARSD